MKENKFGLVYDGAITENAPGQVNIHPVTYALNGMTIAANVYTPADYVPDGGKKYPAVTVAHPNGGVKEQVSGLFAQKLAENGYIAIAADAAYQGASGGEPRNLDTPAKRVEDVHGMVDYLVNFPGVDAERIGLFGICGGAAIQSRRRRRKNGRKRSPRSPCSTRALSACMASATRRRIPFKNVSGKRRTPARKKRGRAR